jgi:hypothetical protein
MQRGSISDLGEVRVLSARAGAVTLTNPSWNEDGEVELPTSSTKQKPDLV